MPEAACVLLPGVVVCFQNGRPLAPISHICPSPQTNLWGFFVGEIMKKTFGTQVLEHDARQLDLDADIIEYRKQMEPDIMASLQNECTTWKDKYPYSLHNSFYLVLNTTVHPVFRVPDIKAFVRVSCPTPVYKQSVWKYHRHSASLEFLWSIPDRILYYYVYNNAPQFLADPETQQLAKFVCLMESGELLQWVKKENGEKLDGVIKIAQESECLIA
jgi:hypothetical protein